MIDTLQKRVELEKESSLLNWYPKIEGKIPTPPTKVLELTREDYNNLMELMDGKAIPADLADRIKKLADEMDEPFFLRSDQGSGKHEWKDTCFVADKSRILWHVASLVEWHACAGIFGLHFDALVFRDYLPLQYKFTAFREMPVAPEWRYFVCDGKVVCSHWYWEQGAIINPSRKDWKEVLQGMTKRSILDIDVLDNFATIFAENNPGYWSVDFALTRDQGWVLIDAARGELSWHPAECIYNPDHDELMREKNRPKPDFESLLVKKEGV